MATHRRHRKWLWTAGILLVLLVSRLPGGGPHRGHGPARGGRSGEGYQIDFGKRGRGTAAWAILRIHDLEVHADSSLQTA